jgi:hypothetical protein
MIVPGSRELMSPRESADAIAFVRFCYERRPVAWPELYDEMTAVAARGLFRGWGYLELSEHGIGFAIPDLPRLAALAVVIARGGTPEQGPAAVPVLVPLAVADGSR